FRGLTASSVAVNNPEVCQRTLRFSSPAHTNCMHTETLCRFDVERVVVEKQHLTGEATQRIHDMLKGPGIRFDFAGEMRNKVAIERWAEPHVIQHPRPV